MAAPARVILDAPLRPGRAHPVRGDTRIHLDLELNYLFSGNLRALFGSTTKDFEAGRLVVFWAGTPHRILATSSDADLASIAIPAHLFLEWRLEPCFAHTLLLGTPVQEATSDESRLKADGRAVEQWLNDFATGNRQLRQAAHEEIGARVRRLGATHTFSDAGRRPGRRLGRVETVMRYIAEHYREPISVPMIAASIGLQPNYLMSEFAATVGVPLWDYVIRVRVSHAQRLLLTTSLTVLEIATEAGFGSPARFYAAFGLHTGRTAAQFRREHDFG